MDGHTHDHILSDLLWWFFKFPVRLMFYCRKQAGRPQTSAVSAGRITSSLDEELPLLPGHTVTIMSNSPSSSSPHSHQSEVFTDCRRRD